MTGQVTENLEDTDYFLRYRKKYRSQIIAIWCQKYLLRQLIDGEYQQVISARNYFSESVNKLEYKYDNDWLPQITRVIALRLCTHVKEIVQKICNCSKNGLVAVAGTGDPPQQPDQQVSVAAVESVSSAAANAVSGAITDLK